MKVLKQESDMISRYSSTVIVRCGVEWQNRSYHSKVSQGQETEAWQKDLAAPEAGGCKPQLLQSLRTE